MIDEGTYKAKLTDAGLIISQAGNPLLALVFDLFDEDDNKIKPLTYRGNLAHDDADVQNKMQEIAGETLFTIGLVDPAVGDDLNLLNEADDPVTQYFDAERVVYVVVEHNEYEGKTYERIKYINRNPGGGGLKKAAREETIEKMKGVKLGGYFKAAQKKAGEDDVPF